MMQYTYLALGDSYTIGEALPLTDSFPYQAVRMLRAQGWPVAGPEILARTGWTTDELAGAMAGYTFLPAYHLVTLLIGVNNQYRGRSVADYRTEFEALLQKSIGLADNKKDRVVVLSIPDYSVTPFAQALDGARIEKEIGLFNSSNKAIAEKYGVAYIGITDGTRRAKDDASLVAADGLHPSAEAYKIWAALLAETAKAILSASGAGSHK